MTNLRRTELERGIVTEAGHSRALRYGIGDPGEDQRTMTTGNNNREKQVGPIICGWYTISRSVQRLCHTGDTLPLDQA